MTPRPALWLVAPLALACACGWWRHRAPAPPAGFADPFSYCTAVGTIDVPDARYTGPPVPDPVARGLRKAFDAPADAPLEPFRRDASWRCMEGVVYACSVGANLPCQAKANTDRQPAPAVTGYCKEHPDADFIPMFVTGRDTVYAWRCQDGAPRIAGQVTTPDARGYLSNIWYAIEPGD